MVIARFSALSFHGPENGVGSASRIVPSTPHNQVAAPHIVAGYEDGTAALWDVRAPGAPVSEAKLHSEALMALAVAPLPADKQPAAPAAAGAEASEAAGAAAGGDVGSAGDGGAADGGSCLGRTVFCGVSGSADSTLAFLTVDAAAGRVAAAGTQALPTAGVGDAAVRADCRVAATGHWDGRVRLWHARKRAPLGVLRYHSKAVAALAFGGDAGAGRLASGGRDGAVAVWSVFGSDPAAASCP